MTRKCRLFDLFDQYCDVLPDVRVVEEGTFADPTTA